jgi:hypothetical protein
MEELRIEKELSRNKSNKLSGSSLEMQKINKRISE